MEKKLIKRIAHNNPSLDGYTTLQVNNIYFYKEDGNIGDSDHINVPLDKFFSNNTIVCVKDDGYIIEGILEMCKEDRVEVGVAPYDKAVKVPYNLCEVVMNTDGVNRKTEMPF